MKNTIFLFFSIFFIFILTRGCKSNFYTVYPVFETTPVHTPNDAADDIAIFIHPDNPEVRAIVATNKKVGLEVYNQQGKRIHEYPFGLVNNVDLRQHVPWNGKFITIVGGSNRTDNSLVFYQLDENTLELRPLHLQIIKSSVDEVYGFCLYLAQDACYAFVASKTGLVEQWKLSPDAQSMLNAKMVRNFNAGAQSEGLVADDETATLYLAVEDWGIRKYKAGPDADTLSTTIDLVRRNKNLKDDMEGLTLYLQPDGKGYLIVSSQGNNSYAVYERSGNNRYLCSFKIKSKDNIGGTSDTDGIDATSQPFGKYNKGIFIAQDGHNGKSNQNFKIVDFNDIQRIIDLNAQQQTH